MLLILLIDLIQMVDSQKQGIVHNVELCQEIHVSLEGV